MQQKFLLTLTPNQALLQFKFSQKVEISNVFNQFQTQSTNLRKMKNRLYILILLFLIGCSIEHTRKVSDRKYLEILSESFPELSNYNPEIKILNRNQVIYYVENVEEELFTSIMELNEYGSLRKSAMRMAKNITEVKNSKEIIFEFGNEIYNNLEFKQQINFETQDLLIDKESKITIPELRGIIGKSINDNKVIHILNNHFGQPEIVDEFSVDYYSHGISIFYVDTIINSISLYLDDDLGFNNYSGEYPKNLKNSPTQDDVKEKFGEPLIWKTHPNYFRYPQDNLIFHFPEKELKRIIIDENKE